jgi:hypothetical protein
MSTYKQPQKTASEENPGFGPNRSGADTLDMSVGNISKSKGSETAKTDGVKIRGTGAATKGVMARGPLA